jgi:hypothetical protein
MDEAGFLRSARGREVSAGVAVSLLMVKAMKLRVGPGGKRRPGVVVRGGSQWVCWSALDRGSESGTVRGSNAPSK